MEDRDSTALATMPGVACDVAWPGAEADEDGMAYATFAADIAQALMQQDYCVIQIPLPDDVRTTAMEESSSIQYRPLKKELQVGYLGRESKCKTFWTKTVADEMDVGSALDQCDLYFSTLGQLLGPLTTPSFGFDCGSRTGSMIRKPFANEAEAAKFRPQEVDLDDIEDGLVDNHIKFCKRRRLCMMHIIESAGATLNLIPEDIDRPDVSLQVGRACLIVFRHDKLSYSYDPVSVDDLVLQSWLLTYPQGVQPTVYAGDVHARDQLLGLHRGPPTPVGHRIGVKVVTPGLPANCHDDAEAYWCMLAAGTDGYIRVPTSRFDIDPYYIDYDSGKWEMGYSYACHAGFIGEDIYSIDNDFFNIPKEEAMIMAPASKLCLQHGYTTLHNAGYRRDTMRGKHICVYAGHSGDDWTTMPVFTQGKEDVFKHGYEYRTWHNEFAQIAYRCDLKGNVMCVDTACSSVLTAYVMAHTSLRKAETYQQQAAITNNLNQAMIVGANIIPGPGAFVSLSMPHMLSPTGRCYTFDGSADGFARGEGTGILFVENVDQVPEDAIAIMIGACSNQDGRSASMTAPNGPSQQECIRGSMREAGCSANDVTCAECHGTGTALGDPIEVGALRGVMADRMVPLVETSAKAHLGHLEACAGMAGMQKCIAMCASAAGSPSPHLNALNPHLDVGGYPTVFATELVSYGTNAGISGVSSFGWGGANGRADIWSPCRRGTNKVKLFKDVDIRLLDYVTTTCPIDDGPIHFLDGEAIRPELPAQTSTKGPYKPENVRDEFDLYDTSSAAYKGTYQLEMVAADQEDAPELPEAGIFIAGSWTQWRMQEMEHEDDDCVYSFEVTLGDSRFERFSLAVGKDERLSLYPCISNGSVRTRVLGPDPYRRGQYWLIDGRNAQVPVGSVYKVTFRWGKPMSVSWELMDAKCTDSQLQTRRSHQTYQVQGTFTSWGARELMRVPQEPNTFQASFKVGTSGREEWKFRSDGNESNMIYPSEKIHNAAFTSVPIRGPDEWGKDKTFSMSCTPGEIMKIKLQVIDALITMEVSSPSTGTKIWQSRDGPERHDYFIRGSFSDWRPVQMAADPQRCGVYRYQGASNINAKEYFNLLVDEDQNLVMYPEAAGTAPGLSIVRGPDNKDEERLWEIDCWMPGVPFEITLDLEAVDKRRKVTVTWLAPPIDFDTMRYVVAASFDS